MADICPAVLAANTHQYREQVERVTPFARRLHIDFMDGTFAPTTSLKLNQAWLPEDVKADLHIMYQQPLSYQEEIIRLRPHLVIVHAEAEGNFVTLAKALQRQGIKAGIALLAETPVSVIRPALEYIDHVLIFSGDLGRFGGQADLGHLKKVAEVKALKPSVEIGWDGGVTDANIQQLVSGGVGVLNVGGYIQRAEDPAERFKVLQGLV